MGRIVHKDEHVVRQFLLQALGIHINDIHMDPFFRVARIKKIDERKFTQFCIFDNPNMTAEEKELVTRAYQETDTYRDIEFIQPIIDLINHVYCWDGVAGRSTGTLSIIPFTMRFALCRLAGMILWAAFDITIPGKTRAVALRLMHCNDRVPALENAGHEDIFDGYELFYTYCLAP